MRTAHFLTLVFCLLATATLFSQDTINFQMPTSINLDGSPPDGSAILDVNATDRGLLVPRLTTSQRTAIPLPANGLLVFDTDTGSFWFFTSSDWVNLSALPSSIANADGNTKVQTEESPDENIIRFDVDGNEAMVIDPVGNVGIGTDQPQQRLDLRGNGTDEAALLIMGNSDLSHKLTFFPGRQNDAQPFIQWKEGDPLRLVTDGGGFSEKMRIDANGNVGIGTTSPDASAILDVNATDKGLLAPRMTTAQRTAIASPAMGLLVFDTDENSFFYFENGSWHPLSSLPIDGQLDEVLKSDANGQASWQPLFPPSLIPEPAPSVSGSLGIGNFPRSVAVQGSYAYVVDDGTDDLKVIDVSIPTAPVLSGSLVIGGDPQAVAVQDSYAYVVDADFNDLKVIDVSNPAAPVLSGSLGIGGGPRAVAVQDSYAYVVDANSNDLKVIDVSDPTAPVLIGSLGIGDDPRSVAVQGSYAYVVDAISDDLKVINVSDPASPLLTSSLVIFDIAVSVAVQDSYAYVMDASGDDLYVIDVSDPTAPILSGSLGFGDIPRSLAVQGSYAYVVDSDCDELIIINVSDPTAPVLSGSLGIGGSPRSVAVQGSYAYVVDASTEDLKVIQLGTAAVGININGELVSSTVVETEADPQVGANTTNYLPKWDGSALVASTSVFEDGSGKVGLSTSLPSADLHIKQSGETTGSTGGIRLERSTSSNHWQTFVFADDDLSFAYNGIVKSYIKDTDGTYNVNSDRRLKKNIEPLPAVLHQLLQLNTVRYHFNDVADTTAKTFGLIAQEVQPLFPDVVGEKSGYLSMDYGALGIISIKAIQELADRVGGQQEIIEKQQAEIESLQSQLSEMDELKSELSAIRAALEKAGIAPE